MESIDSLREAIQLACRAQHIGNITRGRQQILALSRSWVLENLGHTATASLDLNEYRRLLEVADLLGDAGFVCWLVTLGQESTNPDIREVAEEWRGHGSEPI